MRRKYGATLAVTVLLLLAGCAEEPQPRPWEAVADATVRDLTNEEAVEIERAEQRLIRTCMRDKGFPYWEFPVIGVDEQKSGNYVIESVRWARTYGYGREFDERAERIRTSHRTVRHQNALPREERARYTRALDGDYRDRMTVDLPGPLGTVETPRGGCTNEARAKLYGDAEAWYTARRTVESVLPLYAQDLKRDRRFTDALGRWADCMSGAGRPFDSPDDLRRTRAAAVEGMPDAEADAYDRKLAVTEATCAVESSLGAVVRALEGEYRARTLKPYRDQWDTYRKMRLHALRQARQDSLS
ncbi:hypothetical protein OIE82_16070 [Streptomyces althioticus]|uniref:Lipoprotein n=1 Tax=Streptomyces althioticus TaxID=83380 RepID=A0ABZ1Y4Z0_9ACTN|nr:hypothetical protein OG968_16135 [Streptomyces althioticus]WTB93843.1 hypothetical protein OHA53_19410 [Streptomyces althioticus]